MKICKRNQARKLRSESGLSIKIIAGNLDVSKSSVSIWCRDIQLTSKQIDKLEESARYHRRLNGYNKRKEGARKIRLQYQQEGRMRAKEADYMHIGGCMLYWAEGDKSRNYCRLANTNLYLLKFFIKFLKMQFNITNEDLTIRVNCYTGNGISVDNIENYWLHNLGLSKSNLRKSTVDNLSKYSNKKRPKNKHIYGTCQVSVKRSTKIVQHIYGAIQEYGQFDCNYGLD